jgi:drug/metabolite transporter (DMT)-like permease
MPKDKDVYKKIIIYAAISTVGFAFTSIGLVTQSSGVGSVLTYTQPIWVFMLAVPFLSETFSLRKLIGILLGILGISVLFLKDMGSMMSLSSIVLVLGAFLWAVATIYYKLKLHNIDPLFVNTGHMVFATITLFLLSSFIEPPFTSCSWQYASIVLYSGLCAAGIGMTIWLILLKTEDATSLSSASLIVPIIALFLGWVLIGEELGIKSIAGSVLVLIGIYLVNRKLKLKGS